MLQIKFYIQQFSLNAFTVDVFIVKQNIIYLRSFTFVHIVRVGGNDLLCPVQFIHSGSSLSNSQQDEHQVDRRSTVLSQ